MTSSPSDPVLSIVIVPIEGGKQEEPRQPEPPDLCHWQIEEFLRQTRRYTRGKGRQARGRALSSRM